jgi:hypothetical protein
VLAARGAQLAASRGAERPPLLELSDGCRSATGRTAAGPLRPTTELIKRNCSTLMFAISSGRHRNSLLVLQAVQYGRH